MWRQWYRIDSPDLKLWVTDDVVVGYHGILGSEALYSKAKKDYPKGIPVKRRLADGNHSFLPIRILLEEYEEEE